MKKLIALLVLLALAVSAASAETITAMATEPGMDEFVKYASFARVHDYDNDTHMIELELIIPETFAAGDIEGLKAGDAIYTDGKEVVIESIDQENGYIILNKGDYEFSEGSVWLETTLDGNYRPTVYGDWTWMENARIEVPVSDRFLFLDMIDPASGEMLEKPTVHNLAEFVAMQFKPEDPGFKAHNVWAVLDENGELAVVYRFYVPWQ